MLSKHYKSCGIFKKINANDLLKNSIPNKKISDHLPLLVNLQEVENGV